MKSSENFTNEQPRSNLTTIPRCYKDLCKILKHVKECKGNLKTALYKYKGPFFAKLCSLAVNVLKHRPVLARIIKDANLLEKEKYLQETYAEILVYELLFGKGLPGESKPVLAVKRHEKSILNAYKNIKEDLTSFPKDLQSLPKYVRVNKLHTTVAEVLKDLENNSYSQVLYKENIAENEYLDLVKNLECGQFLIDYHFKDLIVFSSKEKMFDWTLYKEVHVCIHDKSSCLPARALNPPPGSTVADVCAAPGNKTLHIASIMKNKGVIHAFERDQKRFELLQKNLERGNVQICRAECTDFFLVDPFDEKFRDVEYVLVDPSCSGSGMVSRMDEVTDTADSKNADRLETLARFQIKMLKHALRFPSARRVVYSTCSTHELENEGVVHEALAQFGHAYRLVCVMPGWPLRGSDEYEHGRLCAKATPDGTLTNGFFVAMFERLSDGERAGRFHRGGGASVGEAGLRARWRRSDKTNDGGRAESGKQAWHQEDQDVGGASMEYEKKWRKGGRTFEDGVRGDLDVGPSQNSNDSSAVADSGRCDKNKRKRKKGNEAGLALSDETSQNGLPSETPDVETFRVAKKKSKQSNSGEIPQVEGSSENSSAEINTAGNDEFHEKGVSDDVTSEPTKVKKNRKKNVSSDEVRNGEVLQMGDSSECHSVEALNPLKAKKKKGNLKNDVSEDSLQIVLNKYSDGETVATHSVKKKKKSKKDREIESGEVPDIIETLECSDLETFETGKVKRNKKKSSGKDRAQIGESTKHSVVDETLENDDVCEIESAEPSKVKKKKKRNHNVSSRETQNVEVLQMEDSSECHEVETLNPSKAKKRKGLLKNDASDDRSQLELNEYCAGETVASHKVKKKKKDKKGGKVSDIDEALECPVVQTFETGKGKKKKSSGKDRTLTEKSIEHSNAETFETPKVKKKKRKLSSIDVPQGDENKSLDRSNGQSYTETCERTSKKKTKHID